MEVSQLPDGEEAVQNQETQEIQENRIPRTVTTVGNMGILPWNCCQPKKIRQDGVREIQDGTQDEIDGGHFLYHSTESEGLLHW